MSEKKVIAKTTGDQKPQMTSEEKIEAGKAELMKVVEGVSGAEKVAELLEKGKKKGKLTSGELMDVLEDMDLDSEQMDKIYDAMENMRTGSSMPKESTRVLGSTISSSGISSISSMGGITSSASSGR